MKFSVADFLGEPQKIAENIFDITPSGCLSAFITEVGEVEPSRVEERIRSMVEQVYS
jgi:translation initiation factor 2B subunit (eIF-2B alpha/beta/delta family)